VPLVDQELLTLPEHLSSPRVFSGVHVTRSLDFIFMFCRSLFALLYFFFWPLCCLFYFDIRILITSRWYLQTFLTRSTLDILWRIQILISNLVSIHLHLCSCSCDDMQMKKKTKCMAVICFSIRLKALRMTYQAIVVQSWLNFVQWFPRRKPLCHKTSCTLTLSFVHWRKSLCLT
jgi:hypothetical protein